MDIARDDQYLLVVTESGFGKRTLVGDYRKTNRGAKGVKTIQQTEAKGRLTGALVVREHHQLVFISQNGMVQRIAVRDFRPLGRNAQGFRLMNMREDDRVSAIALVDGGRGGHGRERRDDRPGDRGGRRGRPRSTSSPTPAPPTRRTRRRSPRPRSPRRTSSRNGTPMTVRAPCPSLAFGTLALTRERGWSEVE